MDFEWDYAKGLANFRKHGVRFADAAIALTDEAAMTVPDADAEGEIRFLSLGMDPMGRILVTAFTFRGERVRIISARKASNAERRQYKVGR